MTSFTIKDLENLSGIKAHTLRIWEQRYNFLKPGRTFTNIRHYSSEELKTILNIALLNKYGYKISHIDKMHIEEIQDKIIKLTEANAMQERVITGLIRAMIDIDIQGFEFVLNNYILTHGIEHTITAIIFPFLEKIGILWLTNHINPSQEHFVSNIIRQKIIVGIEGIKVVEDAGKTFLLFLPEGEHHELGLLFMHYLLKRKGCSIIYLGTNTPVKDVEYITNLKQPGYLYTHLSSTGKNFNFEKFLQALTSSFPKKHIIISGGIAATYERKIKMPVIFKKSFTEVMEFVTAL